MVEDYGRLAAWVYDLDKPIGRSYGDVEHYCQRLAGVTGPVLEPAVGNGRLLIPLLQAGIEALGFDASLSMLAHCRRHLQARGLESTVWQARFEDFLVDRRLAAIVLPVASIELVTDKAVALAVLRRIHDHLAPQGRLILDLDTMAEVQAPPGPPRQWRTAEGDHLTLTAERIGVDHVRQTVTTALTYRHERAGRLIAREHQRFELRWWTIEEMRHALGDAGFVDVVVSAGYRFGRAPTGNEAMLTLEARRR